jgi:alcohol dehydrogenase class IV
MNRSAEAPAGEFGIPAMDRVRFGPGASAALGEEVDRLGGERVLIVTGNTLAARDDLLGRLEAALGDRLAGVFSGTRSHVHRESVIAATRAARELGADTLVSFGGGSPIDTAKLVALCLAAGIEDERGLDAYRYRRDGTDHVFPDLPAIETPQIALSTTLSAGEHTFWGGATDVERGVKDAYRDPGLTPRTVILDPELTVATPAGLWGTTGVKALDHAVETVCSATPVPFATALACGAIEILGAELVRSSADPEDAAARGRCQIAAWMSIFSLSSVAAGLSHALGHQLGAHCGIPHGVTSCIVLPAVMEFNAPVNAARQRLVAEAIGAEVTGLDDRAAAAAAADAVRAIVAQLDVKTRLRDWGVTDRDIAAVAKGATEDHMARTNPRQLRSPEEVAGLLRSLR